MNFKNFLKTRLATWLLAIVLGFVMFITGRILVEQYRVNQQISKLKTQAEKIKKDSEQLSSLIQYFNSPSYEEKQAREKLNLKKDGEYVIGLPSASDSADLTQTAQTSDSNMKKWFNYFFHNQ